MKRAGIVVAAAVVGLIGCGGPSGPGPAKAVLPDVPFEQLDHGQKIQFMKQVVVPTMQPIFQRHDAQHYAQFGCKTCHGEGADSGAFHMPNDNLPKLNFADMSKYEDKDIEWMKTEVKPTMARLLKEPEHSKDNPRGFGCLHCHTEATE